MTAARPNQARKPARGAAVANASPDMTWPLEAGRNAGCPKCGSIPPQGASFRFTKWSCARPTTARSATNGRRSALHGMGSPVSDKEQLHLMGLIDTRQSTFNAAAAWKADTPHESIRIAWTTSDIHDASVIPSRISARPAAPTPGAIGNFFPVAFFARSKGRAFFSLVRARFVEQFPALVQQLGVKPGRKVAA